MTPVAQMASPCLRHRRNVRPVRVRLWPAVARLRLVKGGPAVGRSVQEEAATPQGTQAAEAGEAKDRRWWHVPRRYWWAFAGYLVLAALFIHDWDGYVFATSARQLLDGQTPYEVAAEDPWYGFLNPADRHVQWYAYPPLPILAMAASYAPATWWDLPPFLDRVLLKLPVILGTLALARVAGGWCAQLGADDEHRRRIERRFLTNPFLILVGPVWGMTDTALMALYMGGLLAHARGRSVFGGFLVALSILVKPFPILLLLAITPYLLARDGRKPFFRFAAGAAGTAALVSLPFLLTDARGYWRQAVGAHLARDPQGLTIWSLWPLDQLPADAISAASIALMAVSLLAIGIYATGLRGRGTSVVLTVAAAVAVLVWNRVVNEQYLVLVVAPMLVLDVVHRLDAFGTFLTRWTSGLFAAAIVLVGYHFVTFVPPDLAMPLFGQPVDAVAHDVRTSAPWLWRAVARFFEVAVPLTILALGVLAVRLMRTTWRREHARDPKVRTHVAPTVAACLLLLVLGIAPLAQHASAEEVPPFQPAFAEPRVATFYYLWWQNPAHDPAVEYGNWGPVSQTPEMGYYTNTRGVAREHVRMMVENGIDTAFVSYHRGELERYRVFQEEAHLQGLRVAPLIELNQVYDQRAHHPVDHAGTLVPYAAYRLDAGTRAAVERFVLDLEAQLAEPSTLRIGGRPVVLFYDSYVSGVSFHDEDRRGLATTLFATEPVEELRAQFRDPGIDGAEDLLRHHPPIYSGFYDPGNASLWRRAHLAQHVAFWETLRADLQERLGPLYLISGDALNERAGFEAGTVKAVVGLQVFDGAFVYSPSFTWGNQPDAPFNDTFALWEDRNLWLTALTRTMGATSSTGIAPAYDDTVNRPERGFVIPAYPPGGGTMYGRSWDSVLAQGATLPAVATFNEFFEGSSVEPSREFGDGFLRATAAHRAQMEQAATPGRDVMVVLHEVSSRTSLEYSETDLSHFWGLDLLAAAGRAVPDARFLAVDALAPALPPLAAPDLLVVEGGRGPFPASAAVAEALGGWAATPSLVVGPDESEALAAALGDNCLAGLDAVPDPQTLVAGDVVRGSAGSVVLERAGQAYRIGAACEPGLRAGLSFKPWVATEPISQAWGGAYDGLNARCLAVALKALLPAFAAADAPAQCRVPGDVPAPTPDEEDVGPPEDPVERLRGPGPAAAGGGTDGMRADGLTPGA